jgi:hypothetical protein
VLSGHMTRTPSFLLALLFAFVLVFSGCLTAGHKELRVSLNPDGKSGTATILFTRIHSEAASDTADVTKADFNSLITEYYQGTKVSTMFPGMQNVKKRIFLDGNELNGEMTFDFADLGTLGFYRYKDSGPYMFYTLSDGYFSSGTFEASNGTFGGEKMPFIFWDPSTRDFFIKVALSQSEAPERSLVAQWKAWSKR